MTHSLDGLSAQQASSILLEFTLYGGPDAAGQAREQLAARDVLPGHELPLLLTELVTNAVRHGGARNGLPIQVVVARSPGALRVAVSDPGPGFEWRGKKTARSPGTSGYGLLLVDRLAWRWGIERAGDSTTVWFELPHGGQIPDNPPAS